MPEVALCFTKQASDLEEAKKWGQEAKKWGQSRLFSEEMGSESIIWADAGQQRCRRAAINSTLTPIRHERGYPQLALEDQQARSAAGDRLINVRIIVTFADAGKPGEPKRYADGLYGRLRCAADACDAGNYKIERQSDDTVLLRMTGGLYDGGGTERDSANRHLPDGHVYRLVARAMSAYR